MYPKNGYFDKRSGSPTFVDIPFDPSNHIHHHHYPNSPNNEINEFPQIHSPTIKFTKSKGLVNTSLIPDQTELIFPEDSYSVEFCMPENTVCKCPPANAYREKRRKHKSKSESSNQNGLDHRWNNNKSSVGPCCTDEIVNLENYCSPPQLTKHQQGPLYDVYSYAYLEPPPPQPPSASSSSQSHSGSSADSMASSRSFSSNIYGGPSRQNIPGPSKEPSRSSIKALLARSLRSKNNLSSGSSIISRPSTSTGNKGEKYTYTTRYGTTENLYEEVHDDQIREILSEKENNGVLRSRPINFKEEQRRVQTNHFRILDELNLSLEALIMPSTPPDTTPISTAIEDDSAMPCSRSVENLSSTLNSIDIKDDGDLDSGFSVSSNSTTCYNNSFRGSKKLQNVQAKSGTASKSKMKNLKFEENGIAMTLISPSMPFKSMKKYFDNSNGQKQKSSSDDGDMGNINTMNKFWTIRQ